VRYWRASRRTRCIRFCSEIAGTSELTFLDRGGRTLVWTHDGQPLANDWSGCAADVCPVGALTTREFRFRRRVWYPRKTPSVCPGCNVGCNISIESKDDVVYRFLPRLNPEVNDYWLCDHGRFLSESLNPRDVHRATIRTGGAVAEAHVPAAVERIALEIRKTVDQTGPNGDSGCLTYTVPQKALLLNKQQQQAIHSLLKGQQQGVFYDLGQYYSVTLRPLLPDELAQKTLAMLGSADLDYTGKPLQTGPVPSATPAG